MSLAGKKTLFDDSGSDEEDDRNIKINKSYAQRYDEWREAEIKRKLEDRYGNLDEELSSSSSEDEDDRQELEKALSKDFFEVISQLKKKDPKIYNPDVRFFNAEEQPSTSKNKPKKEKPIYLRDYERKLIVERGGVLSDDESDSEGLQRSASPSLAEKEKLLKESLQKMVQSDSDSDNEGLLTKKVKTAEQKKKDDDDYLEWLRGRKEELKDKSVQESLGHLKEEWNNPNLDEGERFLRDYVLNKRYLDAGEEDADTGNLTDEDLEEKYMDDFERKFNFRFEEPDSEFLKRYPRTIESSVRKKDDRRKRHREEVKKRKEEEKLRQREELKVLKSLKRKEILKKIEKIKEITGNAELGISDKDLEGDYDPEEHDRRMNELFNDDYYQEGDEELNLEDLPLPPLDDELVDDYENWDEYEGEKEEGQMEEELHCEDPNFNMDCDYDPEAARLEKEARPKSSRERRKLKRQSRFGTLVRKKKPEFNPNEKSFQEYLDEYYGIDYEDIVGGQPCRFKYRKVMPNNFGLSIEEILAADDKELNAWISIKKATALKPDHVEINEKKIYELKAQNEALKRKLLPSLFKSEVEENDDEDEDKPRLKNKKENFISVEPSMYNEGAPNEAPPVNKKKKGKSIDVEETFGCNEEEADVGAPPVKKKKKKEKSSDVKETSMYNIEKSDVEAPPVIKKNKKGKSFNVEETPMYKEEETDIKASPENKKKKKHVIQEDVKAEQSDVPIQKKNQHRVNKFDSIEDTADGAHEEAVQGEENLIEEGQSQKLSKKERKRLERQLKKTQLNSVEKISDNCDNLKKKVKKRAADVLNESNDDVVCAASMSNSGSHKKKQKRDDNFYEESEKLKVGSEVSEKSTRMKLGQNGNQLKSKKASKNWGQDIKTKDNKNRVLQNPISKNREKRQRRGKDRKKILSLQRNAIQAPRDVIAQNKERAIRKQNYKAAPIVGEMSDSRLKAYGLNPKKFKNKLVYG